MLDYKGKLVLAPMVRVSELPMRALSLKYGADYVWGPEIVDKKLVATERVVNHQLGTVDFMTKSGDNRIVAFRTKPSLEKHALVFQLGTADPDLAVEAAKKVVNDVSAIEVNCGCPKHFSIHSGMGAALLQTPDKLVKILTSLVEQVGTPNQVAIHAKIRVLDSAAKTYELVSRLVKTGISLLTVHCRTTPMRPREPAFYDYLSEIVKICHENGVPCYVNGDIKGRKDLALFTEKYGVDGVMVARAAESNPSCFADSQVSTHEIVREFWQLCQEFDFPVSHAKYCMAKMLSGKDPIYQQVIRSKTSEMMSEALGSPPSDQQPKVVAAEPVEPVTKRQRVAV